jgi:hypothetical protein
MAFQASIQIIAFQAILQTIAFRASIQTHGLSPDRTE